MSKCAFGYLSVGLCSLVVFTAGALSQEMDGQVVDPLNCEKLVSRVLPPPAPPLPGDVLYYATRLGGLGAWPVSTHPRGMNQLGQVTGYSVNADVKLEAFRWDPVEGMIGLGDLPGGRFQSCGNAVNNLGHVAGYARAELGMEP
ncbi:MAG TPA: hypothetical protein VM487_14360, partial [Phycisphaerae bacterium]|nr:hypothetical protein [Phycisphaerae bacterium]